MSMKLVILVILSLGFMSSHTFSVSAASAPNDHISWQMLYQHKIHIECEKVGCPRGDANSDNKISVSDVIYLINYLFKGGPDITHETEEERLFKGDVNVDSSITISDVVYLINYLFKNGCSPGTPCYNPITNECYPRPCNP
jgi:hypothetical protein